MKEVIAKFKCHNVNKSTVPNNESESVSFRAVYSSDPTHENYEWSKYTPSGSLIMNISNPNLFGHFEAGKEYFLTISVVE